MPVDPSQLYSPGDFTATRKRIFEDSLDAVRKRFPIENTRYTLSLENVDYDAPHEFSLKEQKRAVQNDQSLSWKIKGNWVLTDKATGQVVSKSSRRTIMDIPYLTERGTFIRNGTEMTLPMQMRLVPGVYSRMGEDGMAKAHINARPGTGNTVMMNLNPAKPIFRVSVGTRNYDLFPLLKHNGISDDEIKAAWGDELFKINQDAFVNGGGWYKAKTAADNPDPNDPWEKASKDVFGGELDADNTTAAFGTAYTKVDPRLLLATSSRLIGLAKGTSSGDNRDSMENQRFFGPSDYIAERIRLDAGGLARNLLWRVSRYGDTEKIPSSPLSKYVHGLFTESNLSQAIEETNLLDAYKRATMVTRMGEGGIGSLESAPMSARLVHNTYKGFIDPISSPESLRVGLDTQIAHGAKRGRDGLVYSPVIDAKTGKKVYISSLESSREPVSFPEFRDSKDMLIPAMVGNEIKYLPKSDVKYFIPNGDSLFATASDFVPIKSGIKAGRLLMAQKHQTQAMSIKDRMAPYVQSLDPDGSGKSMEEVNSHIMGAVKAGLGGKVVRVTKDDITVLQSDGTRRSYSLYNNYPLNRKSVVNNTAKVKVGDIVKPGQLLASSSYTDENGVSALGTQLRSGWLSYKGWNYLDAIVVSESAAKKMTSEHFYHEGVDYEDGTEIGRDKYVAAFPSKFNRDQLATIDANGAVKPGTIVKKGDPLVLATSLRPGGPGTGYRALHKDVSSVWDHEFEGEVTDVVEGKDGMRVYVKAWVPLQVGDKMATRFANKGTCAAVIPDEKMPRGADGRPLEILFSPTGIVSRCYDPEHRFLTKRGWMFGKDVLPNDELWIYDPTTNTCRWGKQCDRMHISKYKGELYGFKNEQVDFLVTRGHRIWTRGEEPWSAWRERLVEDVWGKRCVIPSIANRDDEPEATRFYLPPVYGINGHRDKHESELSFDAHDWAELLGWYLSEGNTTYSKERRQYNVNIAQSIVSNPDKVEHIRELLTRMGIKFSYSDKNMQFHIGGIRFAEYFKQFGYCYEKFIPDWLFKQPVSVMKRFLYSMWEGDGNVQETVKPNGTVTHAINIGLTSEKLVEQIQTIITMCGTMCSRHKTLIDPRDPYNYKPVYGLGVSSLDRQYRVLRNTSTSSGWYKVPYSGDVYCPSVETGYVVTMRNGKIACLGNTNSAALIEAALGKVAEKTGKRFILPGFGNDLIALAQKELADAGLSDREDVTDPDTGRVIKGVFTGNSYVTKFHHTSESKGGARSTGSYTADEQPASGGHDGAKTLGGLVLGAFAGHGASEVLKDMKLIKGQKNTDFWRDFKMGKTPNMPGTPLIYKKFLAALEASGVHVTRKGDNTNIFAMTNKDVSNLARTEINSAATYDDKKFLPIKGGLFDPDIFGQEGDQWAKMKLDEPILNPIMDDVVCNFLNLKKADLDAVLSGSMKLPNGETGGEGLRKQLASLNLNTMIENAKHAIRSGPPSKRDKAVKTLRWASAMQSHDVTPDQFMLDEVPVLPPRYRRITRSGDLNMIADANFLYKELLDARDDLRKAKEAGLPDELLAYGRKRISDSFRAVTGLAEPQDRKMQESGVNGLLKWVFGKGSPKCHDDKTEILTEDGWVNFNLYRDKKVKVATLNPITMEIEYQYPTDIIHEPYKGEMIEISNKEIDMCVTHNHNVLLKDSREWMTHRAFVLLYRSNATYTFLGFDNTDLMKEVTVWYTDIKAVPYDGYVHCVTVPNGLIVTRRNGKASVGGNSGGLQRLVIGGKLDVAGRSVINVDPRLNLDEIGMPEKQAWGLYRDFVIRKLVQNGMSPLQATKSTVEHSPIAKEALLKVLDERPVIATRAPALHKFSVQAFRPKLVNGDVLKLNSVVEHAFNADMDGNCVDYDTEIYLMSSLDNSFSAAILNDVQVRSTCEVNIGVTKMITKENSIILKSEPQNQLYFFGKIGELPLEGTPVKDMNGADVYTLPEGVKVWSFNPTDSSFGWYDATKITVEKDCEVCKLTVGGESVIISTNESAAVFDEETGNLKKVTPADSIGMFIPICKNLPTVSEESNEYDAEKGWLHGMMLGDGWLSDSYVGFTKLEDAKRNAFLNGIKKHVTATPRYHEYAGTRGADKYADSRKLHFTDPAVVAWATDLELYNWEKDVREDREDRAALHKEVSLSFILGASDDYLWGLVSGLIDSDGTITKAVKKGTGKVVYGVSISTCSPFLKDSLLALFHRLGVKVGVTQSVHAAKGDRKVESVEYVVMPSASDIQKYLDKLNVVGKLESERIEDWKTQETYKDDRDIIPLSKAEIDMLKVFFPHTEFPAFYASYMKGRVSRQNLIKYLSCVEDEDENLAKLKLRAEATGVFWRAVDSIEVLDKRTVYDLEVPETKVFVVNNGPVIWDTMTYYVPVSDKAVKEAYKLMTPSANQLSARDFTALPEMQEELVSGAYLASHKKKTPPKAIFDTKAQAAEAYRKGLIDVDDNIIIRELQK